jgi:hypothetical protein
MSLFLIGVANSKVLPYESEQSGQNMYAVMEPACVNFGTAILELYSGIRNSVNGQCGP